MSSVVVLLVEYLLYLTLGDPFSEFDAGFELILQKKNKQSDLFAKIFWVAYFNREAYVSTQSFIFVSNETTHKLLDTSDPF